MAKQIRSSVGRAGRNLPADDVATVQYLLNCVPAAHGGPQRELAIDGMAGPKTVAAIEAFQRRQFGSADGRVDPGGRTLRALQARDPYPDLMLSQQGLKMGGGQPAGIKLPWGAPAGLKMGSQPVGIKLPWGSPAGLKMGGDSPVALKMGGVAGAKMGSSPMGIKMEGGAGAQAGVRNLAYKLRGPGFKGGG